MTTEKKSSAAISVHGCLNDLDIQLVVLGIHPTPYKCVVWWVDICPLKPNTDVHQMNSVISSYP